MAASTTMVGLSLLDGSAMSMTPERAESTMLDHHAWVVPRP
jgi:hypothetical protein